MKTLSTTISARERFAIWLHITRNVTTQSGREQDQVDDIWTTLALDGIQDRVDEDGGALLQPKDFSVDRDTPIELTKEELAFLLALLEKPMAAVLSRHTLPIRRRLAEERDRQGLKAVSAE